MQPISQEGIKPKCKPINNAKDLQIMKETHLTGGEYNRMDATAKLIANDVVIQHLVSDNDSNLLRCKLDHKSGKGTATLIETSVVENFESNWLIGRECPYLGNLAIQEMVSLFKCKDVGELRAKKGILNQCDVQRDVDVEEGTFRASNIKGTLHFGDHECHLVNSNVNVLHMKKGSGAPSFHVHNLSEVAPNKLAALALEKKVEISMEGPKYCLSFIGNNTSNYEMSGVRIKGQISSEIMSEMFKSGNANNYIAAAMQHIALTSSQLPQESTVKLPAEVATLVQLMQQNRLEICRNENGIYEIRVDGGNPDGRGNSLNGFKLITPKNAPDDKTRSSIAGYSINARGLAFSGHPQHLQAALDYVAEHKKLAEPSSLQTVYIIGGHVNEIIFEEGDGMVVCLLGGSYGKTNLKLQAQEIKNSAASFLSSIKLTNEQVEKLSGKESLKEAVEPPEKFLDPIDTEIMSNPYVTPQGMYYDYRMLKQLHQHSKDEGKKITCPLTTLPFYMDECVPAVELKKEIDLWLEKK